MREKNFMEPKEKEYDKNCRLQEKSSYEKKTYKVYITKSI